MYDASEANTKSTIGWKTKGGKKEKDAGFVRSLSS
jgi:hypothetical protein